MAKYSGLLVCLGIAAGYVGAQSLLPAVLPAQVATPIQLALTTVIISLLVISVLNLLFVILLIRRGNRRLVATYLFRLGLSWAPLGEGELAEEVRALGGLHPAGVPLRAWRSKGTPLVRVDFADQAKGEFTVISHQLAGAWFRWIAGAFLISWRQHSPNHAKPARFGVFYAGHHNMTRVPDDALLSTPLAQTVKHAATARAVAWACTTCGGTRVDWIDGSRVLHSVSQGLEIDPVARAYGLVFMYSGPSPYESDSARAAA